jgi:hypothetical protein
LLEAKDRLLTNAMAAKTHRIQTETSGPISLRLDEGRDVLRNRRAGANHGVLSDTDELMDPCLPANNCSVSDLNVAGQSSLTGDYYVIT